MSPLPPENINIPIACCACNNALYQEGLRFPKSPELRTKWVEIIMSSTPDYPGKRELLEQNGLQLCVEHFEIKMLIQKSENGRAVYALRKGGYPTLFQRRQLGNGSFVSNGSLVDSTTNEDEEISICYELLPTTSEVKTQLLDSSASIEVMDVDDTPNSVLEEGTVDNILTNQDSISSAAYTELNDNSIVSKDNITSLKEFVARLKEKDAKFFEPWRLLYNETSVLFSIFDEDCKYLTLSFTVNENLNVSVFYHGQSFVSDKLTEVLGEELLLDEWIKFKKLILLLHEVNLGKQHYQYKLKHACLLLKECIDKGPSVGFTESEIKKWKFSLNQIEISDGQNKSFSQENLQWAMKVYNVNRVGYANIFESAVLTLPHPGSLELLKRKLVQSDHLPLVRRPVAKKIFKPNNENGASVPFTPNTTDLSVLNNRNQQILLNNRVSANQNSAKIIVGQSVVPPNNNTVVDDEICEIQL